MSDIQTCGKTYTLEGDIYLHLGFGFHSVWVAGLLLLFEPGCDCFAVLAAFFSMLFLVFLCPSSFQLATGVGICFFGG